jgi:hypothetical protein
LAAIARWIKVAVLQAVLHLLLQTVFSRTVRANLREGADRSGHEDKNEGCRPDGRLREKAGITGVLFHQLSSKENCGLANRGLSDTPSTQLEMTAEAGGYRKDWVSSETLHMPCFPSAEVRQFQA